MMKNQIKSKRGITLIALVITIIVLLILAGVTIVTLTGDNGLLTKAGSAKDTANEAEIKEKIKLAYQDYYLGQHSQSGYTFQNAVDKMFGTGVATVTEENGTFTVTLTVNGSEKQYTFNSATGEVVRVATVADLTEVAAGTEATENSKYTSDGKTAIIPAGFTVSNVNGEKNIDTGLVVTDKGGNQWVWIPVSSTELAAMYEESAEGWTMRGSSVVTKYKSNSRTDVASDLTRVNPGEKYGCKEPDTVVGDNEDCSEAGFSSLNDMATKLRDDYKDMIDSIKKYGGYYIGRYELSSAGTKKNQNVLINKNWYNLYATCKNINTGSSSVESRMIWGCLWDQTCKFISTSGDRVDLSDSSSYGNYGDYTEETDYASSEWIDVELIQTGSNDSYKTNNIYDLAGNYVEWTQEADYTLYRAYRGSHYGSDGAYNSVTYRLSNAPGANGGIPNGSNSYGISSRPTLYIK